MKAKSAEYYQSLPDLEEFGDDYEDLAEFGEEKREKEEKESHLIPWDELRSKYNIPSYDDLTKGWWSMRYVLSCEKLLDIIVGPRSLGKSTNVGLWLIIYFLSHLDDKRNGWIYIRRDKDEVDESAETWFDNALGILNKYITEDSDKITLEYHAGRYHINGKLAGISVSLKKQHKLQTVPGKIGNTCQVTFDSLYKSVLFLLVYNTIVTLQHELTLQMHTPGP